MAWTRSSPSASTACSGHPGFCSNEPAARTRKRGSVLRRVVDPNWLLRAGNGSHSQRRPALKVNNILGMLYAVDSGLGSAAMPDYIVKDHDGSVRVLGDVEGPTLDTYFVYPEELRHSKRVNVFRDFLLSKIGETHF